MQKLGLAALALVVCSFVLPGEARAQYCYTNQECGGDFVEGCVQYFGNCVPDPNYYYMIGICAPYYTTLPDGTTCGSNMLCAQGACNCAPGHRVCGGGCIPDGTCCGNEDCPAPSAGPGGGVCSGAGGSCSLDCAAGHKLCGSACIPNATCCSSADCTSVSNGAGVCSGVGGNCNLSCNGGYKSCGAACIPNAQCCTDGDCPSDAANNRHGVCAAGGTCALACNAGYKACGATCIPNAACCGAADCTTPLNGCYKTQGVCGAGGTCTYSYNDGMICNADNDACTPNDRCLSGACVADTANTVKCVQRACHTAPACNKTTGNCDDVTLPNASGCGGDGCAAPGTCTDGTCSSPIKDCTALDDQCKVGLCDPMLAAPNNCAATNKPNGLACNLADKCILAPACSGGTCTGERKTCQPSASCRIAECNPVNGECEETVAPAGSSCGMSGTCSQNAVCDAVGECKGDPVPDGSPCDLESCESTGACVTGQCSCLAYRDPTTESELQPLNGNTAPEGQGCSTASGHPTGAPLLFLLALAPLLARRRRIH